MSANLGSGVGRRSKAKTAAAPASMRASTWTRPRPRAPPVTKAISIPIGKRKPDGYRRRLYR